MSLLVFGDFPRRNLKGQLGGDSTALSTNFLSQELRENLKLEEAQATEYGPGTQCLSYEAWVILASTKVLLFVLVAFLC